MTAYIYVEGETEVLAMPQLLAGLYATHRIRKPLPLGGSFLKTIGATGAEILLRAVDAHVFACPDLAPNQSYQRTRWEYGSYEELQAVLRQEVQRELADRAGRGAGAAAIARFHPHPFCHDFEVLLLACPDRLRRHLGTNADITKRYRKNPEEQDFDRYPSKVVDELFHHFKRTRYRKPYDAQRVLAGATEDDLRAICARCPRFSEFVAALQRHATRGTSRVSKRDT